MSCHIALYVATACLRATATALGAVLAVRWSRVDDGAFESAEEPELHAAAASAKVNAATMSEKWTCLLREGDLRARRRARAAIDPRRTRHRRAGRVQDRMKTSTPTKDTGTPACGERFPAAATSEWQGPQTRLWQRSRLLRRSALP